MLLYTSSFGGRTSFPSGLTFTGPGGMLSINCRMMSKLCRSSASLGSAAAASLAAHIREAEEGPARGVVVDVGGVDYISSAGLHALESAGNRMRRRGQELIVCNAAGAVRLAMELAGPLPHVTVEASEADAIALATARFPPRAHS